MNDTDRLRRRYNIMLTISVFFLIASIAIMLFTSGLAGWLVVLSAALNAFFLRERRRSLPPPL